MLLRKSQPAGPNDGGYSLCEDAFMLLALR